MASNDGMTREELLAQAADLDREDLLTLIDTLWDDLEAANRIANTQATAFGWCGEYEDRIYGYNDTDFTIYKMRGRVPRGSRMTTRSVFAARRLAVGHMMSTCEKHGIALPEDAWGGVVRDHKALDNAHGQLIQRLSEQEA